MNVAFQNICILGGGLLGGSIALALNETQRVNLWFRKIEGVKLAQSMGLGFATDDLKSAVQTADLLILAIPVGAMPSLMEAAVLAGLPSSCLVTDVGSVKQAPHRDLGPLLAHSGNPFIGSHPMAGSERNGILAARADLFQNAACLLTNDSNVNTVLCHQLEHFWQSMGCRTAWLSALEHDRLVAKISHLPHVSAAATAYTALSGNSSSGQFSGGGLRDTTRVAGGNPEMWTEILLENHDEVSRAISETISKLDEFRIALDDKNPQKLRQLLAEAKTLRDTLSQN